MKYNRFLAKLCKLSQILAVNYYWLETPTHYWLRTLEETSCFAWILQKLKTTLWGLSQSHFLGSLMRAFRWDQGDVCLRVWVSLWLLWGCPADLHRHRRLPCSAQLGQESRSHLRGSPVPEGNSAHSCLNTLTPKKEHDLWASLTLCNHRCAPLIGTLQISTSYHGAQAAGVADSLLKSCLLCKLTFLYIKLWMYHLLLKSKTYSSTWEVLCPYK